MDDGIIVLDSEFAQELGFTSNKFFGYLWKDGDAITISLIISKMPNSGNLSKLFEAIWERGFTVQVPTPSGRMRAILERKGFTNEWILDEDFQESVEVYSKAPPVIQES